jgi:DNA-binding MarR family transcriptional regulator
MTSRRRTETRPGTASVGASGGACAGAVSAGCAASGRDAVDAIVAAWGRERPDLDVSSVAIVSRIARLSARFAQALEANFSAHGLTKASFEALAALRRSGEPYRLSQTALMAELSLTPGTVSVRISRLVEDGLAARRDDPGDRRGVLVELTPAGRAVFDGVVDDHLATERGLLAALDSREQEQLADLLRRLLLEAPGRPGP